MKAIILFCAMSLFVTPGLSQNEKWWQKMSLYQIYPRSFKDSDGDGVGDLRGILANIDHLTESYVDAFWLSPIFSSPMVDFGYDISNFTAIDPIFGKMTDFEDLLDAAHRRKLKVVLDFVPNHTSDQHEWFQKSLKKIEPYTDYYIWKEGKQLENGTRVPPNNWVSVFGGSAWTWREERQAYYLHQFSIEQPDLNYNNSLVMEEMNDVLRFWLNKGVDGFRVDAVPYIWEDLNFLDEPLSGKANSPSDPNYTTRKYTKDQPGSYVQVQTWSEVIDEYDDKVMMVEAYASLPLTMKYYDYGASFPFNFELIENVNINSSAVDFKRNIDRWMTNMPPGGTANWVAGNHDQSRVMTRFGPKARAVTLLTLLLPDVSVTYNGDEIGMEDTWVSWEETKDPQGCNAGKENYEKASRDPARSPFQWDKTTSAGFSTNTSTWLPINDNYKEVNVDTEKKQPDSFYNFYRAIAWLKKTPTVRKSSLATNLLSHNILLIRRENKLDQSIYAILNFGDKEESVDLTGYNILLCGLKVYYASEKFTYKTGDYVCRLRNFKVPAYGVLVLQKL